jgi:hypothetical protein
VLKGSVNRSICGYTLHNELLPIRHVMGRSPLRVEIGIAQSARRKRANAGSLRAKEKCSACRTSMWYSLFRMS